jgi:hypothetical protein
MSVSDNDGQRPMIVHIDVEAYDDRRAIESLYLDLREIAKQRGVKIECQLTTTEPRRPSKND